MKRYAGGRTGTPPHLPRQQQPSVKVQQQQTQSTFPNYVTEVLSQVNDFLRRGINPNKGWNRVKLQELQTRLDNDLFCLKADKRSSRLNPLQQLRLLGIICNYFRQEVSRETDQPYLHFEIIFCGREGEGLLHEARIKLLIKICSLAIQFPVYSLFEHIAYWLGKITSDELKRNYSDRIVNELFEGFMMAPEHEKLYEYLLPLVDHSFEFCIIFTIFSINENSIGPTLALLICKWIGSKIEAFMRYLSQNQYLSQPFHEQKFNLLLRYDCSESAASDENDEVHHQLHALLSQIIFCWNLVSDKKQQDKKSISSTSSNKEHCSQPVVYSLLESFRRIDSLPSLAQIRLLENIISCHRAGFLTSVEPITERFSSMGSKDLAGPHGTLWQSLYLSIRT